MPGPDDHVLSLNISRLLGDSDINSDSILILERSPLDHHSTFPSEIVTCRTAQKHLVLLCKYSCGQTVRDAALRYESQIYSEVINGLPLSHIHCYGSFQFQDKEVSRFCIVLDYLGDAGLLKQLGPEAWSWASCWIHAFHRYNECRQHPGARVLENDHYEELANHTRSLLALLPGRYNWLMDLCQWFKDQLELLTAAPQTLIHGEYYGKNILVRGETVYPIDWETTAIGPGIIDLACLVDGKPESLATAAAETYLAMEGKEAQEQFRRRLLAAQVYLRLRWIKEWKLEPSGLERWLASANYAATFKALATEALTTII